MGEGLKGVWESAKEAVVGLPPMPELQPECAGWLALTKKTQPDGMTWYWIPNKPGSKEGNWHPEPLVKIWFYEDQIRVIDRKLLKVDLKITPYQLEIERIQAYLNGKEKDETNDDISEASIRERIVILVEELKRLQKNGLRPTDVKYRRIHAQIEKLRDKMSAKTPKTQRTSHIADWPIIPGGPVVPQQDLYVLMSNHRAAIDKIKRQEREPLETQRDRNNSYLNHWQGVHEERKKKD